MVQQELFDHDHKDFKNAFKVWSLIMLDINAFLHGFYLWLTIELI